MYVHFYHTQNLVRKLVGYSYKTFPNEEKEAPVVPPLFPLLKVTLVVPPPTHSGAGSRPLACVLALEGLHFLLPDWTARRMWALAPKMSGLFLDH